MSPNLLSHHRCTYRKCTTPTLSAQTVQLKLLRLLNGGVRPISLALTLLLHVPNFNAGNFQESIPASVPPPLSATSTRG